MYELQDIFYGCTSQDQFMQICTFWLIYPMSSGSMSGWITSVDLILEHVSARTSKDQTEETTIEIIAVSTRNTLGVLRD